MVSDSLPFRLLGPLQVYEVVLALGRHCNYWTVV